MSMSALPPKADIGTHPRDIRFVPKADVKLASLHRSGQNASTATIKTKRIRATAICITPNCGASFAINQLATNPTAMRNPLRIKRSMARRIPQLSM
jgi:hypothetical protein